MRRLARFLLVRNGEGSLVAYLAALNLLIGLAMAIGRSSGDALFFKRFGVEYLPQMFLLTSLLLVCFSAIYAEYADRVRHSRMFQILILIIAAMVALNWLGMQLSQGAWPFALYFLAYAVASEIVIVHFSLYASGLLDPGQSKRMMPLISASARLGAVAGGVAIALGSHFWPVENMALAWSISLLAAGFALRLRHSREHVPRLRKRRRLPLADIREGLRFAKRSTFLQISGAGLFLVVVLISLQDYVASVILSGHFRDANSLAAFFGWFYAATNCVVLLLQLLATNRLLQRFGLNTVSLIFPFSTLSSFALLIVSPSLVPAAIARFNYTGMLHAFRNPAANLSYNALPGDMQGRARALNIGFVLPLGLAVAALLLLVAQHFSLRSLAVFGTLTTGLYIILKLTKNRLYGNALIQLIQGQVFSQRAPALDEVGRLDPALIHAVMDGLERSRDVAAVETGAELFMHAAPAIAGPHVLSMLERLPYPSRDRLLTLLARHNIPGWTDFARVSLDRGDPHLCASALLLLDRNGDETAQRRVRDWLISTTPRLKAAAACAAFERHRELRETAHRVIVDMLESADDDEKLAALPVAQLACRSEDESVLRALMANPLCRIRAAAVTAWAAYCLRSGIDSRTELERALKDDAAVVREAAIAAAVGTADAEWRLGMLAAALDDPDVGVRKVAHENAQAAMPTTLDGYADVLNQYRAEFSAHGEICRCIAAAELPAADSLLLREGFEQARLATRKHLASRKLAAQPITHELALIALALREECHRHIESALEILQLLGEVEGVHAIRTALASGNRRLRAQAIESLHYLDNTALVRELLPLLEAHEEVVADPPRRGESVETILQQCWPNASAWLRQCIGQRLPTDSRA